MIVLRWSPADALHPIACLELVRCASTHSVCAAEQKRSATLSRRRLRESRLPPLMSRHHLRHEEGYRSTTAATGCIRRQRVRDVRKGRERRLERAWSCSSFAGHDYKRSHSTSHLTSSPLLRRSSLGTLERRQRERQATNFRKRFAMSSIILPTRASRQSCGSTRSFTRPSTLPIEVSNMSRVRLAFIAGDSRS